MTPPTARAGTSWPSASADVTDRAQRGADVGGMLGPLENDAARLERDLIVGAPSAATPATR